MQWHSLGLLRCISRLWNSMWTSSSQLLHSALKLSPISNIRFDRYWEWWSSRAYGATWVFPYLAGGWGGWTVQAWRKPFRNDFKGGRLKFYLWKAQWLWWDMFLVLCIYIYYLILRCQRFVYLRWSSTFDSFYGAPTRGWGFIFWPRRYSTSWWGMEGLGSSPWWWEGRPLLPYMLRDFCSTLIISEVH